MAGWTNRFASLGDKLDDQFDALKSRLRQRAGSYRRLQVLPYRGFGNSQELYLKGRVLSEREPAKGENAGTWDNVLATYRRLSSVEVPKAVVRVTCGTEKLDVLTDEDGYFELHLKNPRSSVTDPWREIQFELLSPELESKEKVTSQGLALVPPPSARFGIISDIDDTIVVSHAASLLKAAYTMFVNNARNRVAFPGVGAFYRALQKGTTQSEFNPIFYVSSGPWNLYDLLIDFMQVNQIPVGPILLQDYGVDEGRLISASHRDHKLSQIRKLLETYPDLPFILIGDSGQHDPEIYRKVLEEVPSRIKAIYIRDVTPDDRDAEVRKLAHEVREHGGELILIQNSLEAAKHAVERGFISPSALPEIASEKQKDESAATEEIPDLTAPSAPDEKGAPTRKRPSN